MSPSRHFRDKATVLVIRCALVVLVLGAWQVVTSIPRFGEAVRIFDPFFISSPSRILEKVWDLFTGGNGSPLIWPYIGETLSATLIGTACGVGAGAGLGLLLSSHPLAEKVLRPFLNFANAVPRIAIIPVVIILAGPNSAASAITSFILVVFVVFFNALEGGRTVEREMIQSATLLGASRLGIMWQVRSRYVTAWTFAALPNAVSFGLVGAVTAELFSGAAGIGRLLLAATSMVDATLTFAVVTILAVLGAALVAALSLFKQRMLHWWDRGTAADRA